MLNRFLLLTTFICFSFIVTQAKAANKHVLLELLEAKGGYTVEYLGEEFGLSGWAVTNEKGGVSYYYVTPQGGIVMGLMWGADGSLRTESQLNALRARMQDGSQAAMAIQDGDQKKDAPKSELMYADVEKSNWLSIGDTAAPYIYIFVNPTCHHCHTYWTDRLKSEVDAGNIQVRLIPFGSTEGNRISSAAFLQSDNPQADWQKFVDGNVDVYSAEDATDEGYQKTDENLKLAAKWQLPSVPFSIYRAPKDGRIKIISGVPDNMMLLMADFVRVQ